MSKYSRRPKVGELSHELFLFTEITWKISRACILRNNVNQSTQSQSFSFADATWSLHVWPYGHTYQNMKYTEKNSIGWIDLGLQRLNSKIPEHQIFCKFYFKTYRGKEFDPFHEDFIFNGNCKIDWMMYKEKAKFLCKEEIVMNDGVFTIVCQMRTPKINGINVFSHPKVNGIDAFSQTEVPRIEAFSQTETIELVTESSGERSGQEPGSAASNCEGSSEQRSNPEPESDASICKSCAGKFQDTIAEFSENKMVQDFKALFFAQEDCDVVLKVKGQEFSAHRAILRARSPVLASTFRNNMKERATGEIDIEDCDPSSFPDFLCFLYCGEIENLSTENVFSLFTTADKYDVQDLRLQCLEFMKNNLSVDTFCDTVVVALQHVEKELIEFITDYFAKNFQEIIVTVKWQSFLIENPIQSNEIMIKALVLKKK